METIIVILLMVLFYVVPEIFGRMRKKEYQYPEIPQPKPKQMPIKSVPPVMPSEEAGKSLKEQTAMPPAVEVPNFIEQPHINNSAWANGLIMAEILKPPRAHRPIHRKKM